MRTNRFVPKSIAGRLLSILLIVLVPILLAQAALSYRSFRERQTVQIQDKLDVARATALTVEAFIRDVSRQELAIGLDLSSPPRPTEQANEYLARTAGAYQALREFFWLDPDGTVIASSNLDIMGVSASQREYFQAISSGQELVVSEMLQALVGGDPVFVIARGIRDGQGRLQGMVGATVLVSRLGVLTLPLELGGEGTVRLIDGRGRLVYARPEIDLTWEQRSLPVDGLLAQALAGQEAVGSFVMPTESGERIGAMAPVRSIGWAVSASVPASEALAEVVRDILTQLATLVAIAGLSSIVAFFVARSISRPVARLESYAQLLASGESIQGVVPTGPVELERLATSFNRMAAQVQDRTAHLQASIKELEAFSYSVSHDLRTPLRSIDGFSLALLEDYEAQLDEQGKDYLRRVRSATQRMGQLIDDILALSRVTRREMRQERVNLSRLAEDIGEQLRKNEPERLVELEVQPGLEAKGDPELLRIAVHNLLANAWKFTSARPSAKIEFGKVNREGKITYFVRDNGVGFDMAHVGKLFGAFQRLHAAGEFPGTGIGLATVQRIVGRHGGEVWAEGERDRGATVFFTL